MPERVVDAAAATARHQAFVRFNGGIATAICWMAAVKAIGTVAVRPQGRPRTSKLDPHEVFLRDLIDAKNDVILEGIRARLKVEHGLLLAVRLRSVAPPGWARSADRGGCRWCRVGVHALPGPGCRGGA